MSFTILKVYKFGANEFDKLLQDAHAQMCKENCLKIEIDLSKC